MDVQLGRYLAGPGAPPWVWAALVWCVCAGTGVVPVLMVAPGPPGHGAAFPHLLPDRLQFFEYEVLSVSCGGSPGAAERRVMWRPRPTAAANHPLDWNQSAPVRRVGPLFQRDSGLVWCESPDGWTGHALNLSVTAGSVILEVPTRPVVDGQDATLRCSTKKSQQRHMAEFYKDGVQLRTLYSNVMVLRGVTESDQGLYKCRVPTVGESVESWLTVWNQSPDANANNCTVGPVSEEHAGLVSAPLGVTLGLVGLVVLVLVGLLLLWKQKGTSGSGSDSDGPSPGGLSADDTLTYATVQKRPRRAVEGVGVLSQQSAVIYSTVHCPRT